MDNEKDFLLSNLINNLVKDEWDAVAAYESAIVTLTDVDSLDIISILEDIRDEEYVHIGQLESCLSLLKGDPTEHIDDGSEEGFEQLELPEEDDEEDGIEPVAESLTEAVADGIERVNLVKAYDIIDNRKPIGSFLTREGDKFVAIDNTTGDAWTEEFDTEEEAIKWLNFEEDSKEDEDIVSTTPKVGDYVSWVEKKVYGRLINNPQVALDHNEKIEVYDSDTGKYQHVSAKKFFDALEAGKIRVSESLKEDTFAARLKGDTAGSTRYEFIKATDKEGARRQLDKKFSKKGWKVTDIGVADPKATNPYDALKKESKSGLSEKEMKKIICDMVTKYDASEEEIFDELQSQDQNITRDVAHRLFKMCNKGSAPESVKEDFDFDKTWGDLNDIED